MTEPIWEGFVCSVCDRGFDAESWDIRHDDPADELAFVHENCCRNEGCSG